MKTRKKDVLKILILAIGLFLLFSFVIYYLSYGGKFGFPLYVLDLQCPAGACSGIGECMSYCFWEFSFIGLIIDIVIWILFSRLIILTYNKVKK